MPVTHEPEEAFKGRYKVKGLKKTQAQKAE